MNIVRNTRERKKIGFSIFLIARKIDTNSLIQSNFPNAKRFLEKRNTKNCNFYS